MPGPMLDFKIYFTAPAMDLKRIASESRVYSIAAYECGDRKKAAHQYQVYDICATKADELLRRQAAKIRDRKNG